MRNTYKILILIIIFIALGIVWFEFFKKVNDKYPEPELVIGDSKSSYEYMGREFTIKDVSIVDGKMYEQYFKGFPKEHDYKIMLITVNINELQDCRKYEEFDLTSCVLESDAWFNGLEIDLYRDLNADTFENMSADNLNNIDLTLPFWLADMRFSKESWKNLEDRMYYLVFDWYPKKHMIKVEGL